MPRRVRTRTLRASWMERLASLRASLRASRLRTMAATPLKSETREGFGSFAEGEELVVDGLEVLDAGC